MVPCFVLFLSLCGLYNCAVVPKAKPSYPIIPQNIWKPTTTPAQIARYLIHNSAWVSVGSIASQKPIKDYPNVSLKSVSDGPATNSTGIPYFYMTPIEVTALDLAKDNRVTIMASLAQSTLCDENNYDPQEHTCARVFITGQFVKVDKSSPEYEFGKQALFEKHPNMSGWPQHHEFFVAKVVPSQIVVFAHFGGRQTISQQDYFSADISDVLADSSVGQKLAEAHKF